MDKLTVKDIDVKNKRVLVRVDFNVTMNESTGDITDDSRISASLPTIDYLLNQDAKIILCSHLGRPKGVPNKKYSLADVAQSLSGMIKKPVAMADDCIGPEVEKAVDNLKSGEILLLENLRFHPEEEKNDPEFAQKLAKLADVFVNDAFGAAHRAHASTEGVTKYLTSVAGLLLEKELVNLGGILENPEHPFSALLGGAKVSDKVTLMENIIGKVDHMLIGGGMAATFLKSKGYEIGQSLVENDLIEVAGDLMKKAKEAGVNMVLPVDVIITDLVSESGICEMVPVNAVPKDKKIVDIGYETKASFVEILNESNTIFWNGPMGVYEVFQFARGTITMAELLANSNANTVIGGGSTADIVHNLKLDAKMTFVSTGGGASMAFLSGEKLPGVEALTDK